MSEWRDWGAVAERVDMAIAEGARLWRIGAVTSLQCDVEDGRFESPIEAVFSAWWFALSPFHNMGWSTLVPQRQIEITPQERYRADFVVEMDSHPGTYGSHVYTDFPKLAIELDGHDYHEKTKEQVMYRNQRDRALQGAGWQVLHVSGSELYRQPYESVSSVMGLTARAWSGFWSQYWADVARQAAQRAAANQVGA